MDKNQLVEIILQLKESHENKTAQLNQILEKGAESKIKIQTDNGEQIDLPNKHKEGFMMGVLIALEVFGEFPVKISRPDDNN